MAHKIIAKNKKAQFEYFLEERYEAGIVLVGTEIKAIREGNTHLTDAFVKINRYGEIYIHNMHIAPYSHGTVWNHDERRARKLLLHKKEIRKLADRVKMGGYTIIPVQMYLKDGRIKLEIALAKGKKNYDKRQSLKEKDAKRSIERILKQRQR